MRFFFIAVALTFCALVSPILLAAGTYGNGTIDYFQSAYGGWIFSLNGSLANPDSCTKPHAILLPTHSQYKELTALLIAANVSGKPVHAYVSGCHSAGYPIVSYLSTNWN